MGLSSDLVSQFTKITNDSKTGTSNTPLRGIITKYGEELFVKLDGSNELTPISRTVEVAEGDRVQVTIANHSATVTGNLSDPSIGVMRAGHLESRITQTAAEIRMELSDEATRLNSSLILTAQEIRSELSDEINGVNSSINQVSDSITMLVQQGEEFSKFQQTIEGFSFMGKGGSVKISGGDINLTGSITFTDLTKDTQDKIDGANETAADALDVANGVSSTASTALNRANSALSDAEDALDTANSAYRYAQSITIPGYITESYIDSTVIKSPTIEGNEVKVYGTFQTIGIDGGDFAVTGYMGAASGMDSDGNRTVGVALSNRWNSSTYEVSGSYVIVTNAGVRLQYGNNAVVVSERGIWLNAKGSNSKAWYNDGSGDVEIGTGTGASVVAVWG